MFVVMLSSSFQILFSEDGPQAQIDPNFDVISTLSDLFQEEFTPQNLMDTLPDFISIVKDKMEENPDLGEELLNTLRKFVEYCPLPIFTSTETLASSLLMVLFWSF